MANDKKKTQGAETVTDTPTETVTETPATETPQIVADVPATALTQRALTRNSADAATAEQLDEALARIELRVLDLADKYPQWSEGLTDAMARYGKSGRSESLDVSVGMPLTYIRLRHGMTKSKSVPASLKVNVGEFFTSDVNLGSAFDAMVIYAHDSRKYYPEGKELGAPDCQSHDAKFGSKWGKCDDCPYAKYDPNAKRTPCSKGYALMLATPDFSVIGELTLNKGAAQSGRALLQRLLTQKGGHTAWVTEINTVEVTLNGHTNAVPSGGLPKVMTTPEQREVLETLSQFFKVRATAYSMRNEQRLRARGLADGEGSAGALGAGGAVGALGAGAEDTPLL